MKSVRLCFESGASHDYVGVLDDSAVVKGLIASQNAGSVSPTLYYRVDGGGLNKHFKLALDSLVEPVNDRLAEVYDARFGAGSFDRDSASAPRDHLHSFYVPLPTARPAGAAVGVRVVGMVYSVGPVIEGKIVDRAQYTGVYVEALEAVAAVNRAGVHRIDALRITMLSTGIYAGSDDEAELVALNRDAAALILDAVHTAVHGPSAGDLPGTLLINTKGADAAHSKEIDAFTHAAKQRGLSVEGGAFSIG